MALTDTYLKRGSTLVQAASIAAVVQKRDLNVLAPTTPARLDQRDESKLEARVKITELVLDEAGKVVEGDEVPKIADAKYTGSRLVPFDADEAARRIRVETELKHLDDALQELNEEKDAGMLKNTT